MLRMIQKAATTMSAFFALVACINLLVLPGNTPPLMPIPVWPQMAQWRNEIIVLVTVLPLLCHVTVWMSVYYSNRRQFAQLDAWRRLTWGFSVAEACGCLWLAFGGILLYLPSTIALLLVGVAELATILYDVERRAWYTVAQHSNRITL